MISQGGPNYWSVRSHLTICLKKSCSQSTALAISKQNFPLNVNAWTPRSGLKFAFHWTMPCRLICLDSWVSASDLRPSVAMRRINWFHCHYRGYKTTRKAYNGTSIDFIVIREVIKQHGKPLTVKDTLGYYVRESELRNPGKFCLRNSRNPGPWNPEYSSNNSKSH